MGESGTSGRMNRPASCGRDKTLLSGHRAPHSLGFVAIKTTRSSTGSKLVFKLCCSVSRLDVFHPKL